MANIFNLDSLENFSDKLNLDELYEKKRKYDLNKLDIYNKLLAKIHNKIKITARQKIDEQFCWFVVPEIMIGVPKYDQGACIAYIMDKLSDNEFKVKYIHPNVIFICWNHWVPSYVRTEIKKKTGMQIDGNGNVVNNSSNKESKSNNNLVFSASNNFDNVLLKSNNNPIVENKKEYKSVHEYKPSGNMIYNPDLLDKTITKINN
jgi:hypothetical protein|tara:strand:- start:243 stop:854 length:612 start_codon:yes stop_codon:yes gene_type:complete